MAADIRHDYTARVTPLYDRGSLQSEWLALERRVQPAVFLRWLWIGTWLETYNPEALLARVTFRGDLVALGLFTVRPECRHGLISSRRLRLHQTGYQPQDQIWIEYNGLLAAPGHEVHALRLITRALLKEQSLGDELHLSMVTERFGKPLVATLPESRLTQTVIGYRRNLNSVRQCGDDFMTALSANTRYQIRRSMRGYQERYGSPRIGLASNVEDALAAFREAGASHRLRWPDSGFKNPHFTAFHETLIKRGFDHNNAMLYRVMAGDNPVGVFFYLRSDEQVHFYLQGVVPEKDGKLKPGLMSHALLMQHFLEKGYSHYDFMGGDSQYKQQLADETTTFMMIDVHNGAARFRWEDRARRLKQRWQTRSGRRKE